MYIQPNNQGRTVLLQSSTEVGSDLSALKLLRLRFVLRSRGIEWTQFKGFTFHGALGNALKKLDPSAYQGLYDAGGVGSPFVLTPPCDHQRSYPSGHKFLLEITLFGLAISYRLACCEALQEVGRLGIDKFRGKFDVVEILSVNPCGIVPLSSLDKPNPINAGEIAAASQGVEAQYVELNFVTPIRIKKDNIFMRHKPSFHELMKSLIHRIGILGGFVGEEEKIRLLAGAENVHAMSSNVAWVDDGYERYSARQKKTMLFGGLLGKSAYQGALTLFLPYLAQLEYLNLGGKTSFGLGRCILSSYQAPPVDERV